MTEHSHRYVFTFEQDWNDIDFDIEDSGMAYIYNLSDPSNSELFVRLQSWDDNAKHRYFNECFKGRKLKITIETMD